MTAQEAVSAPKLTQITCPDEVTADRRRDRVDCRSWPPSKENWPAG